MPSSPGYKRDYDREKETSDARGEKPKRAARNRARRVMVKAGMVKKGDGQDVDHKTALSKGGSETARDNLRAMPAAKNRSFKRKADGSMK
jgi:hypothetical protein